MLPIIWVCLNDRTASDVLHVWLIYSDLMTCNFPEKKGVCLEESKDAQNISLCFLGPQNIIVSCCPLFEFHESMLGREEHITQTVSFL